MCRWWRNNLIKEKKPAEKKVSKVKIDLETGEAVVGEETNQEKEYEKGEEK